jgi:DNA polymerase-1
MGAAPVAALPAFKEIWLWDFEYTAPDGERPNPACMVAREWRTGRTIKLWRDEMGPVAPFDLSAGNLFVSYNAAAELDCHRVLGWGMPECILDLYVEFRNSINAPRVAGVKPPKTGLLEALTHYGLPHIESAEKDYWHDRFIAGDWASWTAEDREAGLTYCLSDVIALERLIPAMMNNPTLVEKFHFGQALLRGRYMAALSAINHAGVPMDVPTFEKLKAQWPAISESLIAAIDQDYGLYDNGSFVTARFEKFLLDHAIPWERLPSGAPSLEDDTLKEAALMFPIIEPIRQMRLLKNLKIAELPIGADGRNRTWLNPFGSVSGRNQPSNARYIFGPSVWMRSLIKPEPGQAVAYIDWSSAEFGIAAALSKDANMIRDYTERDVYIALGTASGVLPPDATKASTPSAERDMLKPCSLGLLYTMGPGTLSKRLYGKVEYPLSVAREMWEAHRFTYETFWDWSERNQDHGMLFGWLKTIFGWYMHVDRHTRPSTLRNFPMQAGCAEMLRLTCCLATERGIEVQAPVHDALLIGSTIDQIEADVALTQQCMLEASRAVLGGFELRTDVKIVRFPDRYSDKRGEAIWNRITKEIDNDYQQAA